MDHHSFCAALRCLGLQRHPFSRQWLRSPIWAQSSGLGPARDSLPRSSGRQSHGRRASTRHALGPRG
eukprot:2950870-Rhodomonas_salina.1